MYSRRDWTREVRTRKMTHMLSGVFFRLTSGSRQEGTTRETREGVGGCRDVGRRETDTWVETRLLDTVESVRGVTGVQSRLYHGWRFYFTHLPKVPDSRLGP